MHLEIAGTSEYWIGLQSGSHHATALRLSIEAIDQLAPRLIAHYFLDARGLVAECL